VPHFRIRDALLGAVFIALAAPAPGADKPVKVFVLAGQSNMEGHGFVAADPKRNEGKGSLEYVAKDKATADKFKHLLDKKGEWDDKTWNYRVDAALFGMLPKGTTELTSEEVAELARIFGKNGDLRAQRLS